MEFFQELLGNQLLIASVIGWAVAQAIKTIIDCVLNGGFHAERLVGSGGMPSSHSSTVCALVTSAGLRCGVSSYEFAVSFILACVVMYDATGVRQETGKQAKILNAILHENPFEWKGEEFEQKLKEYVGHTPLQVLMGAILGIIIAFIVEGFY